ncbi:MAG: hypothetical protein GXO91_08450 [FCB group bacterium]|nr:hypothetical protein [FCB group bacterium]
MIFRVSAIIYCSLTLLFSGIQFSEISETAGLATPIQGKGVCVFDYNRDGLDDIFVANHSGDDLLFRNDGGLTFTEIGNSAGVFSTGASQLGLAADYDADGDLDLFVGVTNARCSLYRNEGNGSFSEVSAEVGLIHEGNVLGGSWGDYNDDGWPDLYIVDFGGQNYLFENTGGSFLDVTGETGAQGPMNDLCMMATFFDFDNDGDFEILGTQDGYRGNYLLEMQVYGLYANLAAETGIQAMESLQGMGLTIADYNRDGWFDVYFSNLHQNMLFRNNGDRTFSDVSAESNAQDPFFSMTWGTVFFDADNDGWLDIYNNNESGFGNIGNTFFHNLGDGTFQEMGDTAGLESFNSGYGAAAADFDGDGDQDIIAVGYDDENGIEFYRNDTTPASDWLEIDLAGAVPNRYALGVRLVLWSGGEQQADFIQSGNGFLSQNSFTKHFGLGESSAVDSVIVYWPGGSTCYEGLPVNREITLTEGMDCYPNGDLNSDADLDILDIVLLVSYLTGDIQLNTDQECLADANQDFAVDILDIVTFIGEILARSPEQVYRKHTKIGKT